jgi:hypothetical protein
MVVTNCPNFLDSSHAAMNRGRFGRRKADSTTGRHTEAAQGVTSRDWSSAGDLRRDLPILENSGILTAAVCDVHIQQLGRNVDDFG